MGSAKATAICAIMLVAARSFAADPLPLGGDIPVNPGQPGLSDTPDVAAGGSGK